MKQLAMELVGLTMYHSPSSLQRYERVYFGSSLLLLIQDVQSYPIV